MKNEVYYQRLIHFFQIVFYLAIAWAPAPYALAQVMNRQPSKTKATPATPAYRLAVGAGVQIADSIYVGKKSTLSPVPLLDFRWGRFATTGYTADYTWDLGPLKLGPALAYGPAPYKNKDSIVFKGLEEKRPALLGGIVFRTSILTTNLEWHMRTKTWGEGGPSSSLKLKKSLVFAIDAPEHILTFSPTVSLTALSDKETQYQYGVKESEADPSLNRGNYAPKVGVIASPEVELAYIFNQHLVFVVTYKHSFFSDSIVNSPLVDKQSSHSLFGGITYKL